MELNQGRYQIQGVDVISISEEFGTPVYVYDADKIIAQIRIMEEAFSGMNLRIKYAMKAMSNISVLKLMKKQGVGLDAVSIQEVELGLKAGYDPGEILFTPNSVSFSEVRQAVELGVFINIDNISILEHFGHEFHDQIPVCIRLNPHIMAGGNYKISTGHIDSKFGISILQLRHAMRVIDTYNIKVTGLHVHTGSDILDAEVFLRGAEIIFETAKDFPDLEFIDFGSGFKVAYREGDITTDIFNLGKRIKKSFDKFCKDYGRELSIWFEPGKFLVSEAGILLVRTNVVKTTPATVFAGVDSGMNHLLRPSLYDAYHDMINVSNTSGVRRVYSVVGYICETDTLGYDRKMNEIREGDIIAIQNAGAYGFSMASNYNSRLRPAEVLVYNGKPELIRKRETIDDIVRNQVELRFDD